MSCALLDIRKIPVRIVMHASRALRIMVMQIGSSFRERMFLKERFTVYLILSGSSVWPVYYIVSGFTGNGMHLCVIKHIGFLTLRPG